LRPIKTFGPAGDIHGEKARPDRHDSQHSGTWFAILAFGLWGILPVYWKLLAKVSPHEIVAHRVLWAWVFTGLVLVLRRRGRSLKTTLRDRPRMKRILLSGLLLAANWLIFITAVNSGQVLQASLGYYINPLVSVVLGLVLLREKTNRTQRIAIVMAAVAVLLVTLHHGRFPWIALALALTFGFYGLVKKTGGVDPVIGLHLETLLVTPLALCHLMFIQLSGNSAISTAPTVITPLLLSTGVVTAVPLLLFARAAQSIPLSRVGFIQYLTPTCFFLLGRFVYREPVSTVQWISFVLIWLALTLYSWSPRRRNRDASQPARED